MIGELLALFSAFAFALGTVAIARAVAAGAGDSGVLLSVLLTGGLSGVVWLLAGLPASGHEPLSAYSLAMFAASGVLATVWGRMALFKAVQNAGVIRASTVRRLTPFFSVFFAWLLLSEHVGPATLAGVALIGLSFALLLIDNRKTLNASSAPNIRKGYVFGVLCALTYALSYIARKLGLDAYPDPFMGALLGSVAAVGYYLVGCLFSAGFRKAVRTSLDRPGKWQFVAALSISVGQISQFVALRFTGVSQLALINSAEIYIAIFLSVAVFKLEAMPSRIVLTATVLATLGVVLTAFG